MAKVKTAAALEPIEPGDTEFSKPELRRCIGSAKFGLEAHEAPPADFPVQPSQKDGLGRMCKTHWTQYTRALRTGSIEARKLLGVGTGTPPVVHTGKRTAPKPAPKPMARRSKRPQVDAYIGRDLYEEATTTELNAGLDPEVDRRAAEAAGDDNLTDENAAILTERKARVKAWRKGERGPDEYDSHGMPLSGRPLDAEGR